MSTSNIAKISLYSILGSTGLVTNILIAAVIIKHRFLQDKNYVFLLSLAITDWIIIAIGVPEVITNVVSNESSIKGVFCYLKGYILTAFIITSIYHLPCIALHRYFCVVQRQFYQKHVTHRICIGICMSTWVVGLLIVLPAYLGWGTINYDKTRYQCSVDWSKSSYFTIFINTAGYPLPMMIMIFSYLKLILFYRKSRISLRASSTMDRQIQMRKIRKEVKLTLMLLAVVGFFFFCWLLYTIVMYFEAFASYKLPSDVSFTAMLLGFFNSAGNFWIYAMMSSVFRRGVLDLLLCRKRRRLSETRTVSNFKISTIYNDNMKMEMLKEARTRKGSDCNSIAEDQTMKSGDLPGRKTSDMRNRKISDCSIGYNPPSGSGQLTMPEGRKISQEPLWMTEARIKEMCDGTFCVKRPSEEGRTKKISVQSTPDEEIFRQDRPGLRSRTSLLTLPM